MKETRYFYVPEATEHNQLPADEASHAIRVLRLSPGDIVMLIDGKGYFHKAEITLTTKRDCFYSIQESIPQQKTWNGHIHLAIETLAWQHTIGCIANENDGTDGMACRKGR